jgi:hypothetical protein
MLQADNYWGWDLSLLLFVCLFVCFSSTDFLQCVTTVEIFQANLSVSQAWKRNCTSLDRHLSAEQRSCNSLPAFLCFLVAFHIYVVWITINVMYIYQNYNKRKFNLTTLHLTADIINRIKILLNSHSIYTEVWGVGSPVSRYPCIPQYTVFLFSFLQLVSQIKSFRPLKKKVWGGAVRFNYTDMWQWIFKFSILLLGCFIAKERVLIQKLVF